MIWKEAWFREVAILKIAGKDYRIVYNLTPHPIHLFPFGEDGGKIVVLAENEPARLQEHELRTDTEVRYIPVKIIQYGEPHNLPEP